MHQSLDAPATSNDGRALEGAIGSFFAANGYEVQLNAIREGRSGGSHEIDVLATKRDALTTITVAIECKDWRQPIEKNVVSKLDYVIRDLGINKGIIVSTGGHRSGADHAAERLSIDLWGPDELRHRLGVSAVAALGAPPVTKREAHGWRFQADEAVAAGKLRTAARGSAILRRQEEVVGIHRAWVPMNLAQLSLAQPTRKWGRETLTSRTVSNLYEALTGRYVLTVEAEPERVELAGAAVVVPLVKEAKVGQPLEKAYERARSVTTDAAKARHVATLTGLGIPVPCRGITVDQVNLVYFPTWIGVLRLRDAERLVGVSGRTGNPVEVISAALTAKISHVRPALT